MSLSKDCPDTPTRSTATLEDRPPESEAPPSRRERRRQDKLRRQDERARATAWRRQGPAASLFRDDDPTPRRGAGPGRAGLDDDYIADRGQWEDLKGPTPRGLRRNPVLDRLGWYEVLDRDATITSTRQVVATNPALIRSQPPFSGSPTGIDEQTGMYTGSDPFVLYENGT